MQGIYHLWATKNDFKSMLPSDCKAEKEAQGMVQSSQKTLDAHVHENPPQKRLIKYSDSTFKLAAAECLSVS
ncbi:hypothetical protein C0992_002846 [Termitomyces sp. T32_za158]|nr:hypothetical protein C0992_002846 [Termitomyces sp. T32_za158]